MLKKISFAAAAFSVLALLIIALPAQATVTVGDTSIAAGGSLSIDGAPSTVYTLGPSTTTGSIIIGGTAQTGNIIIGQTSTTKVGIGDTTPASLLTVGNGDLFQVNSSGAIVAGTGITLTSGNITTPGNISTTGSGNITAGGTVTVGSFASATSVAVCSNSGILSVCNVTPASTLQQIYATGNTITTTDARNISITLADTATDQTLEVTQAGTALAFRVNDDGTFTDSTPFVIDDSGNVGIGITIPTAKLHVVGNSLFGGTVSSPGSGSASERFGANALAAGSGGTALGNSASAATVASTAIGTGATASTAAGTTAIGYGSSATATAAIAFGVQVTNNQASSLVVGSDVFPINTIFFGKGISNATPTAYTIQGTAGNASGIAGADVSLAGGFGGAAADAGGNILFKTAAAGTGTTLTERMRITSAGNINFGPATAHLTFSQTTGPTTSVTGTGFVAGSVTGTDTKGHVTATVGAAAGTVVVTFNIAYASAPDCTLTAATATAQADSGKVYVTSTTGALTLNFVATPTGGSETFNYFCAQ